MSPRFRLPTFTRSSRPDSRVAIASLFLALACHSNERSPRDGSGDGAVEDPAAHPAPDGSAPDAGPDTGRPDVMPVSADLQPDADPLANVGICEPQAASVRIRTDDGKATIAAVEATGCLQSFRTPCWPGGDAGPPACAVVEATTTVLAYDRCSFVLTSTRGQRAKVEAPILTDQAHGFPCKVAQPPPGRLLTNYPIYFDPAEIVISFDGRDAGRD